MFVESTFPLPVVVRCKTRCGSGSAPWAINTKVSLLEHPILLTLPLSWIGKEILGSSYYGYSMGFGFFKLREQATENYNYLNTEANICSILVTKQKLIKLAKPGD